MNKSNDPRNLRGTAPVPYAAIVIGVLILLGVIAGVLYGRRAQNPVPSAVTSPAPGASAGATPRY